MIIPLVLGWRRSTLVVTLVVSWMLSTPVGLPALQSAHRFRDAGLVWAAGAALVVGAWLVVRPARLRRTGRRS